jgi:hypothetical protein
MTINVAINSIDSIINDKVKGQLPETITKVSLKIDKQPEGNILKLLWEFGININNAEYLMHKSRTTFKVINMTLDNLIPTDKRVEIIAEMAVVSLAHSRILFMRQNKGLTNQIPVYIGKEQLMAELFNQIMQMSN